MTRYNCLQFIRPGQADENTIRLNQFELNVNRKKKIRIQRKIERFFWKKTLIEQSAFLFHLPEKTSVISRQMMLPNVTMSITPNQNHKIT